MSNGQAARDDNNAPAVAGWDATGHQIATAEIVSVTTDATTGVKHGALNVNATFSASSLAINDPTTTTQKAGVNAAGSLQVAGQGTAGTAAGGVVTIQGIAGGTAVPISGTISATNPSVGTDGSAIPTSSTLLGASDGTNLQQLLVESASNRNLRTGIYSGANEATVTGANALKVDNSAVTQPVNGTVTANAGTGSFTVAQATSASLNATATIQAVTGTSLAADVSNTELRTSLYAKNAAAGDTALTITSGGSLHVNVDNANTNGQATMANSAPVTIASDQTNLPMNLKQINSATLSPSNPNIVEGNISNWIRAGNGFTYFNTAVSSTATNGGLTICGLSIFNPIASGKSILLYSIITSCNSGAPIGAQLRITTIDPSGGTGFTAASATATNLKAGGGGSASSVCASASGIAATVAYPGNAYGTYGMNGSSPNELLTNGAEILLPAGNGLTVLMYVNTAGNSFQCTAKGIEY